jgi:hypothetical protein
LKQFSISDSTVFILRNFSRGFSSREKLIFTSKTCEIFFIRICRENENKIFSFKNRGVLIDGFCVVSNWSINKHLKFTFMKGLWGKLDTKYQLKNLDYKDNFSTKTSLENPQKIQRKSIQKTTQVQIQHTFFSYPQNSRPFIISQK